MDHLDALAGRLQAAAAAVTAAAGPLDALRGDPREVGADAPGRPGEAGRGLHAQWSAALAAREREAGRVTAGLAEVAAGVLAAARSYADADAAAAARLDGAGR